MNTLGEAEADAARHFGDNTAYMMGRITLNPIKHIDPERSDTDTNIKQRQIANTNTSKVHDRHSSRHIKLIQVTVNLSKQATTEHN
jgi:hypothetical protein